LLTDVLDRAAHASGVIGDLAIEIQFQAAVIARVDLILRSLSASSYHFVVAV
jgi:hypothetical protein